MIPQEYYPIKSITEVANLSLRALIGSAAKSALSVLEGLDCLHMAFRYFIRSSKFLGRDLMLAERGHDSQSNYSAADLKLHGKDGQGLMPGSWIKTDCARFPKRKSNHERSVRTESAKRQALIQALQPGGVIGYKQADNEL